MNLTPPISVYKKHHTSWIMKDISHASTTYKFDVILIGIQEDMIFLDSIIISCVVFSFVNFTFQSSYMMNTLLKNLEFFIFYFSTVHVMSPINFPTHSALSLWFKIKILRELDIFLKLKVMNIKEDIFIS